MTNHTPVFTSSSATGSFSETANTTDSIALHQLSGSMNFTDSDHSDTHTTSASLTSAVLSSGSIIPASSLTHFQAAMTSQITSDSNGSGKVKWSFSDADDDFDFLAKNQSLVLTYKITLSDNHGGTTTQTVRITVTGTDDKPVVSMTPVATVSEQADQTLSLSPDTAHITLNFTDDDLTNIGHTATVVSASASGATAGLLPGSLGTDELMAFFHVDNVVKNSGSSAGTINTTFTAPDLAFDYLAAGQQLNITYAVQLDDHAGGVTTQNVMVTIIGTNDKPVFLSGPEFAHLTEGQNLDPSGNLHAHGDLLFADVDLADTHTVSTTVTASRSGGGAIPLDNAALLAAFATALTPDSTGHLIGDTAWNFTLSDAATNFLSGGETLSLVYHVTVQDPSGGTSTQDVTITILGTNHPVVITSGPESTTVSELADTTGSAAVDTTPTVPAGTLTFTDADTSDTHSVAVTLASTSGATVPAATQADLAAALTTTLHDSTGTGTGGIDWNFAIADQDLDYLAAGETLTVNYNVKVSDASTSSTETVSVVITGANDAPVVTSGPESASLAEQPGLTDSPSLDTTSPVPTGTLNFADVDLLDVHSVSVAVNSAVWSTNGFVPGETQADLQAALATMLHDSTGLGTGSVDWTFSIPDRDLDFLSVGENLTVTYDVTVTDGTASSTQQVTITIDGAADPLVVDPFTAAATDTAVVDDGNVIASGSVAYNSLHPVDLSAPRTITEVNGSAANVGALVAGAHGSLLLDTQGTYTYIANASVDAMQVGDSATDQFTFTIDDGQGHQATTTLTFDIAGADDAPIITGTSGSGSITEDAGPAAIVNGDFETGDLTGWTATGSYNVERLELGGSFGHYSSMLAPTNIPETLSQDIVTTPGQHYFLSFDIIGDPEGTNSPLTVTWDGITLLSTGQVPIGVNHYAFDVVGDAALSSTSLQFTYADDTDGMILDAVSVSAATGPATESTSGTISFSDAETADTHTAAFAPLGNDYVGTFTLDPVTDASGTGSVGWHFTVDNSDIQFLARGQTLVQDYLVTVNDAHGGSTVQDITVTMNGTNDAPTAVSENIITDAGANGTVDIPAWALAANDSDPDTIDHLSVGSIVSSSGGGTSVSGSDVSFADDATAGGSFNYTSTDGSATSSNAATATITNNAASATALTATGGDSILIATNGTETMTGGGGNDILIGNSGSHVMTGGAGNDTFAFLHTTDGPGIITDFNNTAQHDHIAISASGFGGGLTAGMDVTSTFETSGDDQFSGFGAQFHFDSGNQTLYYSVDGTQASAITVASVQAGVVLNPHDLLVV
jgi:VCBS repeat-containing protein